MKNALTTLLLLLAPLAAIAATETGAAAEAAVEPLGTLYLVCIALAFVGMLAGFYWYYMRWDKEEDEQDS